MGGWYDANRWHDALSRRDAARILHDAGLSSEEDHGDDRDPEEPPRWYRNPWVWVVIVMVLLIVGWFIAAFG